MSSETEEQNMLPKEGMGLNNISVKYNNRLLPDQYLACRPKNTRTPIP